MLDIGDNSNVVRMACSLLKLHTSRFNITYEIRVEDPHNVFYAFDGNRVVARFIFRGDDEDLQLCHMKVATSIKQQGIGQAIIEAAIDYLGYFMLPSLSTDDRCYLTEDGPIFIARCFEKNVFPAGFRNPLEEM